MEYGSKEYNDILNKFSKRQGWLQDVSVEIVGGENNLSPITLLRAYDEDPTIDSTMALASQFVMNKEVKFMRAGVEIHSFIYRGGDLSEKFEKAPYLLDVLLKLCYGLMIKKLTPPSEDSEKED